MQDKVSAQDYTSRRGELSAYGRAKNSANRLQRFTVIVAVIGLCVLILALLLSENNVIRGILLLVSAGFLIALTLIWRYTKTHFIEPDLAFRMWLQRVCDGELEAGIGLPSSHRHFKELDFHTRNLTTSLRRLSTDMETLVDTQTQRLENQNHALELLFQLTSDVVSGLDLQSVLNTVCTHLSEWLDDSATAAYMLDHNALRLQVSSGDDNHVFAAERPAADLPEHFESDSQMREFRMSGSSNSADGVLRVPIVKSHHVVGMVEIIAASSVDVHSRESQRVFQTVSDQLSVFVSKESALESAHNARLIKERTQLGADLHDSLAQTLLATGYQVKMLRESVQKNSVANVSADIQRIEEMLGEANAEVRGMIGEYREPLSEHRHANAIKKIIDDFNRTCDIEVFFQLDDPTLLFTPREDTVVQRIIGEALNNARKYSRATTIRVYLRVEASGARSILVEDDGIGFSTVVKDPENAVGDHIGLSVMHDRALSIGAILTIESEHEEGTRVSLKLPPLELSEGVYVEQN